MEEMETSLLVAGFESALARFFAPATYELTTNFEHPISILLIIIISSSVTSCPYCNYQVKRYAMGRRHTISIDYNVYTRLKKQGVFGESFTDVISRILYLVEDKYKGNNP
jgi:hypothetical protein